MLISASNNAEKLIIFEKVFFWLEFQFSDENFLFKKEFSRTLLLN